MIRARYHVLFFTLLLAVGSFSAQAEITSSPNRITPLDQNSNAGKSSPFIRLDNGALKLAAAPNAEAETWAAATSVNSAAAYQAYIKAYPKGRYIIAAKIRLDALLDSGASAAKGNIQTATAPAPAETPSRPNLPIAVEGSTWQALESSSLYRNASKMRGVTIEIESATTTEHIGSKNSSLQSLPQHPAKRFIRKELSPISDKCLAIRDRQRLQVNMKDSEFDQTSYICAHMVGLGSTSNGAPQTKTADLRIEGDLLPPKVGAEFSVRMKMLWLADAKYDMGQESRCRITDKLDAKSLHPKLSGTAWAMQCSNTVTSGSGPAKTYGGEDFLIEDLGLPVSLLGQFDLQARRHIIPSPGSKTVIETQGDYASRMTTEFSRYDLTFAE